MTEKNFMDKILSALKKSGAALYQITETKEESAELFFIRRALDMQRQKEIRQAAVTVYKDFSEGDRRFLGSAAVQVQDSFTQEQMEQMFRDALYAAGFVKNPYYELYHGTEEPSPEVLEKARHLSDKSLAEVAGCFADALFAEDTGEDVFLNSAEIFATRTTCHILNSSGVDASYCKGRVKGEFVAQCISGQDVETYEDFSYEDMETQALRRKVRDTLEMTRARAQAVTAPPAGEYRVILSGTYVKEIFSYYVERSNMSMVYPKYSPARLRCTGRGSRKGQNQPDSEGHRALQRRGHPHAGQGAGQGRGAEASPRRQPLCLLPEAGAHGKLQQLPGSRRECLPGGDAAGALSGGGELLRLPDGRLQRAFRGRDQAGFPL